LQGFHHLFYILGTSSFANQESIFRFNDNQIFHTYQGYELSGTVDEGIPRFNADEKTLPMYGVPVTIFI